jgi:hypothetical protein
VKLDLEVRISDDAEERAWRVVRAAYEERVPAPRERRRVGAGLALAAAAAVVATAVTPPGRAVLDSIRETVGVEKASPALFSLPTPGRVLVTSASGPWVVRSDGSKRRLGSWREASWSPFGRYVVAARRNELAALEPDGSIRWTLARRDVGSPRWGGTRTDTRIAYLSGGELRVVAGDGTGDHRVAEGPVTVAPAWRPGPGNVLAYALANGRIRVVDSDGGTILLRNRVAGRPVAIGWVADRLLVLTPTMLRLYDDGGRTVLTRRGRFVAAVLSPPARQVAVVRTEGATSAVDVVARRGAARLAFSGSGRFGGLAWSPDGRWLLVTWPDADQWVFVRVGGVRRIVAVSNVSRQFGGGSFPRLAGWVGSAR